MQRVKCSSAHDLKSRQCWLAFADSGLNASARVPSFRFLGSWRARHQTLCAPNLKFTMYLAEIITAPPRRCPVSMLYILIRTGVHGSRRMQRVCCERACGDFDVITLQP
jgi:hypothetical protein